MTHSKETLDELIERMAKAFEDEVPEKHNNNASDSCKFDKVEKYEHKDINIDEEDNR